MIWLLLVLACGGGKAMPCGSFDGASCLEEATPELSQGEPARSQAHDKLADACERLKHGPACTALARSMLDAGNAGGADVAPTGAGSAFGTGLGWHEKGCALRDGEACYELGRLHLRTVGIPKDESKARQWFTKACTAGNGEGCVDAGILLETGKGTTADPEAAVEMYRTACSLKHGRGCTKLGLAFRGGVGVDKDPATALEALERGCGFGFAAGCGLAAMTLEGGHGLAPDPQRRLIMLREAIRLDDRFAARTLDTMLQKGEVPDDQRRGLVDTLASACTSGMGEACLVGGRLALVAGEREAAVTAWQKGCADGAHASCAALALEDPDGVIRDGGLEALAVLHERGCSVRVTDSCVWLGKAYETGEGVELVDLDDAQEAFGIACKQGSSEGCEGQKRVAALRAR